MMKLIFILIIFIPLLENAQNCSPEEINLIDESVNHIDSLINSNSAILKVYVNIATNSEIVQVTNFDNWPENIVEIYNIYFDNNNSPIYFSVSPYCESGDWNLDHSFYFNKNGNTIYYKYYFSFFNSMCTKILRKNTELYFDQNYIPIREREYYTDQDNNLLSDISNCENPYEFKLDYLGNKSFYIIVNKYKIDLD